MTNKVQTTLSLIRNELSLLIFFSTTFHNYYALTTKRQQFTRLVCKVNVNLIMKLKEKKNYMKRS